MDTHQAAYSTLRHNVIVERVDEELGLAENRKRTREAADEYADMSKRVKLTQVDPAATGTQHGTTFPLLPRLG